MGSEFPSKDSDFADLVAKHGPPPQVIWLGCDNLTNRALRVFLASTLRQGIALLEVGEPLVRLVEASSEIS